MRRRAFTLIELLIVVGIIAVLISILFVAVRNARLASGQVACASNMRQLGTAMTEYANDNKGRLPYAGGMTASVTGGPVDRYVSWDDLIAADLGIKLTDAQIFASESPRDIPLLRCPAGGDDIQRAIQPGYARTYSPPRIQLSVPDDKGYYFGGICADVGVANFGDHFPLSDPGSALLTDIKAPSTTLMLVEQPNRYNMIGSCTVQAGSDGPFQQYGFNFGNATFVKKMLHKDDQYNYLFCDLHVELLHWEQTLGSDPTSTGASPKGYWTRNPSD